MDSLSQAALGAAVAVAVTRGVHPKRAIVYGVVLGTLPDLDVLQPFENDLQAMINHRSWSHAFVVHLIVGPLLGLLLSCRDNSWSRIRWVALVVLVWITHAALDAFTIYGTWLFWPFTRQPVMGGSIFIIDPLYTLPLLITMVMVWRKPHDSRVYRWAITGLAVSCLYLGWGLYAKQHIEQLARQSLADSERHWTDITATPTPFNSVLWRIIALDHDQYHEGYFRFLEGNHAIRFDSIPRHPELGKTIPETVNFNKFEGFNHGYYKLADDNGKVIASDLRMGLEPYFIFRFVMKDSQSAAKVPRAAAVDLDSGRVFHWLARRFTCPAITPLRVQNDQAINCNSGAPSAAE